MEVGDEREFETGFLAQASESQSHRGHQLNRESLETANRLDTYDPIIERRRGDMLQLKRLFAFLLLGAQYPRSHHKGCQARQFLFEAVRNTSGVGDFVGVLRRGKRGKISVTRRWGFIKRDRASANMRVTHWHYAIETVCPASCRW